MKGSEERKKKFLYTLLHFVTFFLLMCFIITCCMMLFLREMQSATGVDLLRDNIQNAALLTFLNVILLSLICSVVDAVRRHFMVDRPVKKITSAAEQIMQGDLSVRIGIRQGHH
jgi:nitrogen fixation/metabolism regulation signal transduction histidine kinase